MTELDALDHALVRALQDDARQTNRDLAAAVHAAPSTSSERVRALRATGVIRGYHADVALEALGRRVQALIAVRIRPPSREHIEAFRDWAGALPETVGVFVVSGGDDFLLQRSADDPGPEQQALGDEIGRRIFLGGKSARAATGRQRVDGAFGDAGFERLWRVHLPLELVAGFPRDHADGQLTHPLGKAAEYEGEPRHHIVDR
jgi:DNA-binding Lrp family transcriptional regulator